MLIALSLMLILVSGLLIREKLASRKEQDNTLRNIARRDLELADLRDRLRGLLTPLLWTHEETEGRPRYFVAQALVSLQHALRKDDEEMGFMVEVTPDPPKAIPTRQLPPPWLAVPEDLIQTPRLDIEALERRFPPVVLGSNPPEAGGSTVWTPAGPELEAKTYAETPVESLTPVEQERARALDAEARAIEQGLL